MLTVIVSGAIANKCFNGGATWTRLSWVLGLRKLGCRVFFVEQIAPQSCVDRNGDASDFATSANLDYFKQVVEAFGLSDSATLLCEDGEQSFGLSAAELLAVAETADLLINITGHLTWPPLVRALRRKVYIDLDPGYTQFWHAAGIAGPRLEGHDFYFTVGENIGTPHCAIPTADIRWRPTRQPVVLDDWPVATTGDPDRFTTIASWRGPYGAVEYGDKRFGLKVHEFRKFIEMPGRAPQRFEIALDIHPAEARDLHLLSEHGWQVAAPRAVAGEPFAFRQYVQNSGGEFSVAQGIYVETNSGWFSDRTVRYLATGKPALVQETGFSRFLSVGEGLLSFRSLDEAIAGAEAIEREYDTHSRTARRVAEEFFDSNKVLNRLLEEVGV